MEESDVMSCVCVCVCVSRVLKCNLSSAFTQHGYLTKLIYNALLKYHAA